LDILEVLGGYFCLF